MALPKKNRLVKKKDFDTVFRGGRVEKGSFLLIKFKKNSKDICRFGFSISKKIYPKATERNRIKRVLTEGIRAQVKEMSLAVDVIVVVKNKGEEKLLVSELKELLKLIPR